MVERCWICKRTKKELIEALDQLEYLSEEGKKRLAEGIKEYPIRKIRIKHIFDMDVYRYFDVNICPICLDIIEKTANSAIELMIERQRELLDKLRKEF